MGNFVESTKEAARGGFKNIKTVKGLVVKMDVVDPPEGWQSTKKLFKVWLEDAVILEYFEEGDEMELKDGKFEFSYTYAEAGKKPSGIGTYMRCLVAPLEKAGKKPSQFIGQVTTFSKIPVVGFKTKNKETGEEETVMYEDSFGVVLDDSQTKQATNDYIKKAVTGLNSKATLKFLLTDSRAKNFPEYKDALNTGKLGEMLGLKVENDIFVEG